LDGQTAVVTGGAQGIGFAIAERLVRSGASVALWDIDASLLEEAVQSLAAHGKAVPITADVTKPESIQAALDQSIGLLGDPDILVNNAGISGPTVPTWEYAIEDWRRVLSIDLDGVFYCCRAVVPGMIERNYGRIVNIASIAGKEGNPNAPAYSAAKAGVIGFTKSLGKELADKDISVNCITPAAAKTRIFDQITEKHISYMLSKIPRGRFLKVEEAASLVAWLVSRECSFTTGGVFDISGGRATY